MHASNKIGRPESSNQVLVRADCHEIPVSELTKIIRAVQISIFHYPRRSGEVRWPSQRHIITTSLWGYEGKTLSLGNENLLWSRWWPACLVSVMIFSIMIANEMTRGLCTRKLILRKRKRWSSLINWQQERKSKIWFRRSSGECVSRSPAIWWLERRWLKQSECGLTKIISSPFDFAIGSLDELSIAMMPVMIPLIMILLRFPPLAVSPLFHLILLSKMMLASARLEAL